MSDNNKRFHELLSDWLASLWFAVGAGLSTPLVTKEDGRSIDPDFDGWLHGDPSVTKNPTSRYGDRTPGYITGNGLGSMEIGAADD